MRLPVLLLLCAGGIASCAPFPELDALGPVTGAPPALLPIDDLLAQAEVQAPDPGPALAARAAAARARAAALRAAPAP
jgi:hypothetical protein